MKISGINQNEAECLFLDWLSNFDAVDDADDLGALLEKVATSKAELPPEYAEQLGVGTIGDAVSLLQSQWRL